MVSSLTAARGWACDGDEKEGTKAALGDTSVMLQINITAVVNFMVLDVGRWEIKKIRKRELKRKPNLMVAVR
jgi:hypothetical protein